MKKTTHNEESITEKLADAIITSSKGNGHDFGFIEDVVAEGAELGITPQQVGGVFTSLQSKGLVAVYDPVTTDAGTFTQFQIVALYEGDGTEDERAALGLDPKPESGIIEKAVAALTEQIDDARTRAQELEERAESLRKKLAEKAPVATTRELEAAVRDVIEAEGAALMARDRLSTLKGARDFVRVSPAL